ncbi:hypothetical protein BU23DRAFT_496621 [Bimuria novae-zelandiae CBS 107.79]|uniref:Uncharacterized protein n=1 Tax=Bimuria novae-zelandiae CBS 107.79 TaxID=1447943 RepID=A0A6A5VS88_9PLEO|nr:hypothetical protein BU23DRAFT_496621 [Bimuria novae-zelandiae CBS 107.79]
MTTTFLFIDSLNNDRFTKSLARSHVLKGKNVGRKLNRRPRVEPDRRKPASAFLSNPGRDVARQLANSSELDTTPSIIPEASLPLNYLYFNDHLLDSAFPIEVTLKSQHLVQQFYGIVVESLYPPRLCHSLYKPRRDWLHMLFEDHMSYHCSMALMASMDSFFTGRGSLAPKAVYHLGCAVNLVNKKLATADALSDSTLAVVNFLVVQHLVREEHVQAEVHHKGLRKMVELRGGLSQLAHNEMLALKLCKTDVDYALHYGTSTCFYRDHMAEVYRSLRTDGFVRTNDWERLPPSAHNLNPFLRCILQDVMNICALFNNEKLNFRLESSMLQEFVVSVGHRVVQSHPLSETPLKDPVEGAYHIGLAAFVTTLMLQFGRRRYLKFSLVGKCLKEAVMLSLDEEHDGIVLWLLFLGGISVLGDMQDAWLGTRIRHILARLGIKGWTEVRRHLVQYPWISAVHDDGGKRLWEFVMRDQARIR